MPLVRYEIRSEHSLANPDLFRSAKDEPEALLEGVAVAGLVGIVRQIGDLAEFAADIFRDLHEEVLAVASRGHDLAIRVHQIEAEMPSVEKALLSETNQLKFAYNRGTEWHASIRTDQNHCTQGDLPRFVRNSYDECRGPPRLSLLDRFDVGGAGACLKRYTDPSYFKTEWASSELLKAEQAQRDSKARRGKRKGRRRKGSNESVDSVPVTQINARVRYSSRGVETDGASGSSSSLNSDYLSKHKEVPNWRGDSSGGSGSSSFKDARAPLAIIQGQEEGGTSNSSAAISTAYLKQPRVALPPSRVVNSSGSGSGASSSLNSAEHSAKPAREALPPSQQAGTGVPGASSVQQISVQSNGVGLGAEVSPPNSAGSRHSRQASGSKQLTPAIEADEPLKLSAKDIEAESLSGRFVRVQQKANLETAQEHLTDQVDFRRSGEQVSVYPTPLLHQAPSQRRAESLQDQPLLSQVVPSMQPASDYYGVTEFQQTEREDPVEDVTGEVDNFVDALATMDSDGETDADTRTSESRPRHDADADDEEVQSKLVTDEPTSNERDVEKIAAEALIGTEPVLVSPSPPSIAVSPMNVSSPSPLSAEVLLPGQDIQAGEDTLSPTESNTRLSLRTVDSAELISPSQSSTGLSSPGTFPDFIVTPRSLDVPLPDKAKSFASETNLGLSSSGRVTSPSRDLHSSLENGAPVSLLPASVEVVGLGTEAPRQSPTSEGISPPADSDVRPPRPSESSATASSTVSPAVLLVSPTASASEVNTVVVPAPDPPSPTGTVIVLPSPTVVRRAPWDLSSPPGSTSEHSTPRVVEGYAHELASPGGSTSDTSSLYKVQSPPRLYIGRTNMEGGTVPAEHLSSFSMSMPSLGKGSPPGAHLDGRSSGQNAEDATTESGTNILADDLVLQAEVEDDYLPVDSSEEVLSVLKVVTEDAQLEEGNSSRSGPQAELEEIPLSSTKGCRDKELADQDLLDENLVSEPEIPPGTSEENMKDGAAEIKEAEFTSSDPLLHLLSSEEEPDDELDEELAVAAGSRHLSPTPSPPSPPTSPSPPALPNPTLPSPPTSPNPPSPPSSPSPRAPKFSVLDPLSLSDTEAKDTESSPRGSNGSSPRSSVFSALNSPMSPPLHSRKLLKSPETRRGRTFRASETVSPVSPTRGSRLLLARSPARPEILPLLPPLNPGQWQGVSAYHERRHSVPVEFGRSPSRVPAAPPLPIPRDVQSSLPTRPMPTRRAPVPGQQNVIDAIAAHDKSKLKTVPPSLQSPSKLSSSSDREVMLQQIRTKSFNLRDTKSVPRAKSVSPQRPVTNINVAAILEKANAIRQAFTGSDEDDEEEDQWSDK